MLLGLAALTGCSLPFASRSQVELIPGNPAAPSQVEPAEAIAIAQELASHPWQPFARNILHGKDPNGITVHTPDIGHEPLSPRKGWWIPGFVNNGIPYKWGGFDDPESFDAAIAKGHAAGDVSSPAKRLADNAAVSSYAAGLDCSGFVSKCLKLPKAYDTRQLPKICDPLADPSLLQPGDILNIERGHVLLCAGWADPQRYWVYYYETGAAPNFWKPSLRRSPIHSLIALGYQPLRYQGMARPLRPTDIVSTPALTRSVTDKAIVMVAPVLGEP